MYDLIYVASAAPTNKYKSGHSRKYLDTVEAMEAYLARMEDDGLLYFSAQPGRHKIRVMREVLRRRGIEDLSQHVIHVNGRHHIDHKDNLYFPEALHEKGHRHGRGDVRRRAGLSGRQGA
jgi:hypothetical protein